MSIEAVSVPRRSPSPMSTAPLNRNAIAPRIASTARIVTPVGRGGFGRRAVRYSLRHTGSVLVHGGSWPRKFLSSYPSTPLGASPPALDHPTTVGGNGPGPYCRV